MPKCHACNDEGRPGGCPRCGLTPRKAISVELSSIDIPANIIPIGYQGLCWSKPNPEGLSLKFRNFDEKLERVYEMFLKGNIPSFSMFISAPPKSGKNLFAYSCMQTAIAQKFTVAPLLSTSDWRRLHKISQMNPFYKLFGQYKWDELAIQDVVFLYIDHSDDHNDDIPLLKTVMDTRAAFNLSTFIISDYRLNDLVPKWKSEIYTTIYNPSEKRDFLRYPVVLHRFE